MNTNTIPELIWAKINKVEKSKPDDFYEEYKDYDISSYVSPYYVNPYQKEMLRQLIGQKNIDDMTMLNTLVHAGIINTSCPPFNNLTRNSYSMDYVKGVGQCSVPDAGIYIKEGNLPKNPFKIQKYPTHLGIESLSIPMMRGQKSCAPENIYAKNGRTLESMEGMVKHGTTVDGTGYCTNMENVNNITPNSLVETLGANPLEILYQRKLGNFIDMIEEIGLPKMKKIIKYVDSHEILKDKHNFLQDPKYHFLEKLLKNLNSDEDLKLLGIAYEKIVDKENNYSSNTQKSTQKSFRKVSHKKKKNNK